MLLDGEELPEFVILAPNFDRAQSPVGVERVLDSNVLRVEFEADWISDSSSWITLKSEH